MEIIILGSGTSSGIPVIGCECPVCISKDLRDQRLRSSVYIDLGDAHDNDVRYILIDCGPDFRQQALRYKLPRIDAVLFTHAHADHIFGLDDIRMYNFKQKSEIPLFADSLTAEALKRIFTYCFYKDPNYEGGGIPSLTLTEVSSNSEFYLGSTKVTPIRIYHGRHEILGFRIGDFAYLTDCSKIPDESIDLLQNLEVLIISGLRHRTHPTHFNVKEAQEVAVNLGAKRTFLTHISHDLSHSITEAELSSSPMPINLAFDGLKINLP
jgi:phosphoribosyl 1,2-cyclic phosphate phosphodiesterase